jgi:hypothetical protein
MRWRVRTDIVALSPHLAFEMWTGDVGREMRGTHCGGAAESRLAGLFVAQGGDGIELHGGARGDEGGGERDDGQ